MTSTRLAKTTARPSFLLLPDRFEMSGLTSLLLVVYRSAAKLGEVFMVGSEVVESELSTEMLAMCCVYLQCAEDAQHIKKKLSES